MTVHSIKTDNANIEMKVQLRRDAVQGLKDICVLDAFAGNNVLWSYFNLNRYYGIEKEKCKGKNLHADNIRVLKSLDLSQFNVIDLDSYGIPFNQLYEIFENESLKKGTVIIYTCISNKMSTINKRCIEAFGLASIYKKVKTIVNGKAIDLFYGWLYKKGIKTVKKIVYESNVSFCKEYGYFTV